MSQAGERTAGASGPGDEPYDALVARLERVVADLEAGGLTLEQSIERFAEGVRLAREASRKLDDAERRVEMLVRSADGDVRTAALDPETGRGTGSDAGR
ncbi:MAG TPA: exodeoxyribonuclease VII small subunit [Anaeromyxobacteraceae bacterium]|nr:exodeoxyribonuclease VII small subunit [Anaeromyxobacteraceae bacterium]